MKTYLVERQTFGLQDSAYCKLNHFSQKNKNLGRCCSIPISLFDVGLDALKMPFIAIEKIAMAAINLIGAAFSNKYRLKDALISLESGLMATMAIPVKLVLVPFKISFQFFAIIINPVAVKSISDTRPTFKQDA